ncbi:hypothetical protein [Leifsonia sp. NPDC080035]|uniref:DUF6916 domain-containing protein n=1 Tax=Leifsonia sp. NPDC080035 TaxID=3143936 RepID=A0AAU7GGX2_9MICO
MTAYDRWAAVAGTDFDAATADGERHRIRLAEVSEAQRTSGWLSFTLRFDAPAQAPAEQQTYELTGAGIAEPVFLVPVGRTADGLSLEAVFTVPDEEES